jgi:hydroxymethylglutaryl-CoA reductase
MLAHPNAVQALFAATSDSDASVAISVAILEIYNEAVRDLLGGPNPPSLDVSGVGPGELQPGVRSLKAVHSDAVCLAVVCA